MRRSVIASIVVALVGAATMLAVTPASAHVVPSTVVSLDIHESDVTAALTLPAADLETASGIAVSGAELSSSVADEVAAYLAEHLAVSSSAGSWEVEVSGVASTATSQWGTGEFDAVTATATLTPPGGAGRSFVLAYDAIVHQVITADIVVVLHSDWATGELESSRTLGTISVDTVSGTVAPLAVDLDDGSAWQGLLGMLRLGVAHIAEGTDHQLFLITLLLPAPLLVRAGRWRGSAGARDAVRRITAITIAFTIGHSVTLALGALGLLVPQQPVEALIAVSILVAAVHAVRPIFPGREPLIAGLFGLVHGLAFATTLADFDLSGGQLALSLLGFNLGIELMQLAVVALVLPPLFVLARTRASTPLRLAAATLVAVAAIGWLLDRLGVPTPLGTAADALGSLTPWLVSALWAAAVVVVVRDRAVIPTRVAA